MTWKRVLLAVLLLASLLATGTAYVRIADVHAPTPDQGIDADRPPQAVIDQARDQFRTVEHRSVSRVYRVDESDERALAHVFEDVYDYDDRRYVANYLTTEAAGDVPAPHYHFLGFYHGEVAGGDPIRSLIYATDARSVEYHGDADEFAVGAYAVENSRSGRPGYEGVFRKSVFLNHTADWREIEENESTLVLGIDDPEEYYGTRPTWGVEDIHEGSSIRASVDKGAGRVDRIVEHRVVTKEVYVTGTDENGTGYGRYEDRRVHYLIETEFTDYGDVDLKRPDGVGRPTIRQYLYDFLDY